MNKLIIVMLAVCLVSAHAFVKRDAPPADKPDTNYLDQAKAQLDKIGTTIKESLNSIDSAKIEQDLKKFMDDAAKALSDLTKKNEAPKS